MKPKWILVVAVVAATAFTSAPRARAGQESTPTLAPADGSRPAEPPAAAPVAEVEQLRGEVERLRAVVERQERVLQALEQRLGPVVATERPPDAGPTGASVPTVVATETTADDSLEKKVDELTRRWGKFRLTGDLQMRYEGFFNQGFDAPSDLAARNRLRLRVRAQLAGEITKNFDWGVRLASGSFDNPISPQQTFTDYYTRKPIAIDRAYLHFDSKTEGADLELWAGKFEAPWKRTPVTFDEDLQPEGLAQSLRFGVDDAGPLRSIELVAWQLPFRERSIGADAVLLGGQLATDWKFSDRWSATASGTFHDFEQVDVIPPAVGVSPTLVNGGFDYGTTNAVVVNPFTNLPEYRSEYRVIDGIVELRYAASKEGRWPVLLRIDWIHNTSAYNNERDGGQTDVVIGRRQERGDWQFDYTFWKVEREAFPSVFMDSEMVIQTNSVSHAIRARTLLHKQVELTWRYFAHRRLATTLPDNRWLSHLQFDVQYRF
jgi:hypothetical protein